MSCLFSVQNSEPLSQSWNCDPLLLVWSPSLWAGHWARLVVSGVSGLPLLAWSLYPPNELGCDDGDPGILSLLYLGWSLCLTVGAFWRAPRPLSALLWNLVCLTQAVGWWEILVVPGEIRSPWAEGWGSSLLLVTPTWNAFSISWAVQSIGGEQVMAQVPQILTVPTKM